MWRSVAPLAVLLLAGGLAFAAEGDSPGDAASKMLATKLYLVEQLSTDYPDGAWWRTWPAFLKDLDAARGEHPDDAKLSELRSRAQLAWGKALAAHDRPDDAAEQFRAVLKGPEGPWHAEAATALGHLLETKADALGDAADSRARAIALYEQAREFYASAREQEGFDRIRRRIVLLKSREGLDAYRAREYGKAYDLLSAVESDEGTLPAGEPKNALEDLRAHTGMLALKELAVSAPGDAVGGRAQLVLTPTDSGEKYDGAASASLRLRSGRYRATLRLPGRDAPVLTDEVTIDASTPAELQVPAKAPEGMVFIPASPEHGVPRPFFMDRTEVTEAAYHAVVPSYPLTDATGRLPAHGITFAMAQSYAQKVGKSLPSEAQWLWAAFRGSKSTYPWPGDKSEGRCNMGSGSPSPVGSFPDGQSPFGVLDMAGNVWEWLSTGYAIGAGFRGTFDQYRRQGYDPLREPKPGEEVYDSLPANEKEGFTGYRVAYSGSRSNVQEVGLRCVLPL